MYRNSVGIKKYKCIFFDGVHLFDYLAHAKVTTLNEIPSI